jgi:hypothetical protein
MTQHHEAPRPGPRAGYVAPAAGKAALHWSQGATVLTRYPESAFPHPFLRMGDGFSSKVQFFERWEAGVLAPFLETTLNELAFSS